MNTENNAMGPDALIQAFEQIARSRRSVRGFLPDEAEPAVLEAIFRVAQTAPSNCNTQPWQAYVASGEKCQQLKQGLVEALMNGQYAMDYPFDGSYQGIYKERQHDAARQLYSAMGIARDDKAGRQEAFLRNFKFFDAPHVVFLFMPENFGVREAADLGMYAQNLMLAMAAYGLASCPQTALGFQCDLVREQLGVPDHLRLLFGISFGYEDPEVAANKTRVGRVELSDAVTFCR